jgi:trk system potassium uptake protein TrkA
MRVIIMGAGRTGSRLAVMLERAGHDVTVIDWDRAAFQRLPEEFGGEIVIGNGVDQDVLRAAGIETADAFVASTSGDNRNIMASQIAHHVFRVPRVISRIRDPIRADIYERMGIEVDCRTIVGADTILDLVLAPGAPGRTATGA